VPRRLGLRCRLSVCQPSTKHQGRVRHVEVCLQKEWRGLCACLHKKTLLAWIALQSIPRLITLKLNAHFPTILLMQCTSLCTLTPILLTHLKLARTQAHAHVHPSHTLRYLHAHSHTHARTSTCAHKHTHTHASARTCSLSSSSISSLTALGPHTLPSLSSAVHSTPGLTSAMLSFFPRSLMARFQAASSFCVHMHK